MKENIFVRLQGIIDVFANFQTIDRYDAKEIMEDRARLIDQRDRYRTALRKIADPDIAHIARDFVIADEALK